MACHCSSPLLLCHVEVGCICPPGRDCQERLERSENLETEEEILTRLWEHLSVVIAVPVSLVLLLVVGLACCVIAYYNVKLKRMKSLIRTNNDPISETDNRVEADCKEDRQSITSLSQVLSLYLERREESDLETGSDRSVSTEERSLQHVIGSISSQDTTLDMEESSNYEYQDYDHLDHNRSVNDVSQNYCQY